MIIAVIVLALLNILTLSLYFRARYLNKAIGVNQKTLMEWLHVQRALHKAAKCMIVIKQVDPDSVFLREPPR